MMQLTYLAHASFQVKCGSTQLVFDPWFSGPAYGRQRCLWPLPAKRPEQLEADVFVISHRREERLPVWTLRKLKKKAALFFPFRRQERARNFLHALRFDRTVEAVCFRTYMIGEVNITYLGYSSESVVVIEHAGEVLVNIGEALCAEGGRAAEFMIGEIRSRWKKVDYLLTGWYGTDFRVVCGTAGEREFADRLCRFTEQLQPRCVVPFAPGFLLLCEREAWAGHHNFLRRSIGRYYAQHYRQDREIRFLVPFPGDELAGRDIIRRSHLHILSDAEQMELAIDHYKD